MSEYPLNPPLECDIVMKGGITSGVIYPAAVCELAKSYRLRSLGGASAGAIAAATAAAAEFGREQGGFDRLAQLPRDIAAPSSAGGSTLFHMFQPHPSTAALFRLLTAGMGRSGVSRMLHIAVGAVAAFPGWGLVGALPGIALTAACALGQFAIAGVLAGVILTGIGGVLGLVAGACMALLFAVPRSGFGLCTGMPPKEGKSPPALTPWLHERLQALAGRTTEDKPLTFGDLSEGGIDLRTMTTNLTRRSPIAMPWGERDYFFSPSQFCSLFPASIVAWMEDHPPALESTGVRRWRSEVQRLQARPLLPLPAAHDLPVLVAVRMSLSFPLLIAAVPLHAVDYAQPLNWSRRKDLDAWRREYPDAKPGAAAGVVEGPIFDVNWFSDGGICTNLPVHFFDSALPTRPTFTLDLAPFPRSRGKRPDEADNSYLATTNTGGLQPEWSKWPASGPRAMRSFIWSIVDSARSWVHANQLVMPGYRDRVVTIWHDQSEGGMNLNMPADVVLALSKRGRGAASKLAAQFAWPTASPEAWSGWDNHRWIRFRTATAGLAGLLQQMRYGYIARSSGGTPYSDLAGDSASAPLPSYLLSGDHREAMNEATNDFVSLAEKWKSPDRDPFSTNAPSPRARARLVPDDGTAAGLEEQARGIRALEPDDGGGTMK